MSTHTSPSGASSKLTFEFVGSTTSTTELTPVALGQTSSSSTTNTTQSQTTQVTQSTQATDIPDTGFFTGDSSIDPAPLFVFALVASVIITIIAIILKKRPHVHRDYSFYSSDHLSVHDIRSCGKSLLITLSCVFSFSLLIGIIFPQFVAPSSDQESNAVDGYLDLSITSTALSGSASLSSSVTLALASQTVSASSNKFDLYINVSEDSVNGNYLFLNGDTTQGYIAPTSGTITSKRPLSANEWGFTTTALATARKNGSVWAAVPLYGSTSASNKAHSSSDSTTSVTITYGAAGLSSSTPNGAHSQTIVYTAIAGI